MNTNHLRSSRAVACASLAFALLIAAGPVSAATVDTIRRSFEIPADGRLEVEIRHGRIEVNASPTSEVTIEIVREVTARSRSREEELLREDSPTIGADGSAVTIRTSGTKNDSWTLWSLITRNNTRRDYRYTISVPARFNLDLKTSGGAITVNGVAGTITTRTSGGRLKFDHVSGEIDGRTSGGGIALTNCSGRISVRTSGGGISARDGSGDLRLGTSGGGITVANHRGDVVAATSGGGINVAAISGRLDARTSGGSIRADMQTMPQEECRLRTSGGGITVSLPEDAAFALDAATSGGGVRCAFPVTVSGEAKRNQLSGAINGGGPSLHLRTSGGSIRVERS